MKNTKKNSLISYVVFGIIGFGLGGIFFGWRFHEIPSSELFIDPIPYLPGVILWGILGGISLSILSKNIKQIFRASLFGIIGWLFGGLIGLIIFYFPAIFGSLIFSQEALKNNDMFWWLVGATIAIGAFIGGFYALALKIKIWPMASWGAGGFTLGTIIGIIIENALRGSSLLVGSIAMFLITGIMLGALLGLGVYRSASRSLSKK